MAISHEIKVINVNQGHVVIIRTIYNTTLVDLSYKENFLSILVKKIELMATTYYQSYSI